MNFSGASRLKVNYFCRMAQRHSCVTLHYVARMLTLNRVCVCVCVVVEHVGAPVPHRSPDLHQDGVEELQASSRRP